MMIYFPLTAFCRRLSVVWCSASILCVSIKCWAFDLPPWFSWWTNWHSDWCQPSCNAGL